MEIYKAAEEFQINCDPSDRVWYIVEGGGYYSVRRLFESQGGALPAGDRYITKQRGGIRHFKTSDAALSAIRQIGQNGAQIDLA